MILVFDEEDTTTSFDASHQILEKGDYNQTFAIDIVNMEHDITIKNCIFLGPWYHAINIDIAKNTNGDWNIKGKLHIEDSYFIGVTRWCTCRE